MFLIALAGFGNFFYVLQKNVPDDGFKNVGLGLQNGTEECNAYFTSDYVDERAGDDFSDAIISMYLLALGEFSLEGFTSGHDRASVWIMFICASITLNCLMLNLIITLMGEPFAQVKEDQVIHRYKQKLDIITENLDKV